MITTKTKITLAASSMAASALLAWGSFYYIKKDLENDQKCFEQNCFEEMLEHPNKQIKEFEVQDFFESPEIKKYYFVCRGRGIALDFGPQFLGEKAAELAEIKDSKGYHFFSCENIAKYLRYGGEADYAWEVASVLDEEGNNKFYGAQLPQMAALKLSIEELVEFKDTEKPNALFVYPTFDVNVYNFEGALKTPQALQFFNEVKKGYDVKTVVASTEKEVYNAIDYKDNFKLLILSGHGEKTALQLGGLYREIDFCRTFENHCIDVSDVEFSSYLDKADEEAVIFLNSCSTAEEGEDVTNLANHIFFFSNGRKVIASTGPFGQHEIKINSIYPFDVSILRNNLMGRVPSGITFDTTYIAKDRNKILGLEGIADTL